MASHPAVLQHAGPAALSGSRQAISGAVVLKRLGRTRRRDFITSDLNIPNQFPQEIPLYGSLDYYQALRSVC